MKLFGKSSKQNGQSARNGAKGYSAAPSQNGYGQQPQSRNNGFHVNGTADLQARAAARPKKKQKKSNNKRRANKRSRKSAADQERYFSEQMGDVRLPLTLADPNHQPWMHFSSDVIDNLRQMMTRINSRGEIPSRLALVSALPGEGVTYIARALASVMANDLAARVCLVDLNWWSPASPPISPPRNNGLVSVVTGKRRLDEIFVRTSLPNLTIVPAGNLERAERPVMARSNVLTSGIDVLSKYFDHLILDIPAIRATNDAVPLATLADGVCIVMRQGVTPVQSVKLAIDEIQHLNIMGVVMNRIELTTPNRLLRLIPQD